MSIKDQVTQSLDSLTETDLHSVVEYITFLKFRTRTHKKLSMDKTKLAALYAEFADEDRQLAEEGIDEYATNLVAEDAI